MTYGSPGNFLRCGKHKHQKGLMQRINQQGVPADP